jgi:hypothetical protein
MEPIKLWKRGEYSRSKKAREQETEIDRILKELFDFSYLDEIEKEEREWDRRLRVKDSVLELYQWLMHQDTAAKEARTLAKLMVWAFRDNIPKGCSADELKALNPRQKKWVGDLMAFIGYANRRNSGFDGNHFASQLIGRYNLLPELGIPDPLSDILDELSTPE